MKQRKALILRLLDKHRVMALATNRSDGWPQVTQVGYVNDGFLLYCFVARNSQKHAHIQLDPRISIAIGSDAPRPLDVEGLSLAGRACVVTDQSELAYAGRLRLKRYPEYAVPPPAVSPQDDGARIAPRPSPHGVVLLRVTPELFSVLDYSRGFGHSDLVSFSERDLDLHVLSSRHRWDANPY